MTSIQHTNNKDPISIKPIDFDQLVNVDIHKPAQYMGFELGVKKHSWTKANVRWVLTYPELYEVGASNLGHIILYSILNKTPNQICDRAYLPENDLAKKLRTQSIPLFAVESRRPLKAFDILGFSLSYELGATNILEMLDLAQIPIYAKDREDLALDDPNSLPIIFAGGPTATSNPEPYAAFFDFVALGDGEELLPEIGLVMSECKKLGLKRSETLISLSEVPGVYVPALYKVNKNYSSLQPLRPGIPQKILRRVANPLPQYATGLVPNIETVHDRLTVEIRRGCTRGCRFCQPGMLTRPARDVEPKEVIDVVEKGIEETGYSDFSLLSLSCSDYLALPAVGVELRNRLAQKNITLQLPSQRVDRFNDDIAHILGGTRKAGLTFAPEAGTQRLRNIINKGLTDADLLKGIRKAMENGYKKVKLYFMIGLPGETDDDVIGISKTCKWLQTECKDLGHLNLNITISNFTPKPHTPFQWHSVSRSEFSRRQKLLKNLFVSLKGIKINFTDIRISSIEDFLGRGDRRLSRVIESAWKAGAGMDAWFESQDRAYEAWSFAIQQEGLAQNLRKLELGNWLTVKSFTEKDLKSFCSQELPWDHIDTGIEKQWLIKDFQLALNESIVPDCSFNACSSCGVCGSDLGHNQIAETPEIPAIRVNYKPPCEKKARIKICFQKCQPMHLISHLDLMRILERALRRSNLPVSYTGGFHPLPRLQIGLALPLGVEAFNEWMYIDFYKDVDSSLVLNKLQENLPKGIELKSAENITITKNSLSQEIIEAIWSFNLNNFSRGNVNINKIYAAVNKIKNSKKLILIDTDKKGRKRERDFRSELKSLKIIEFNNQLEKHKVNNSIHMELRSLIDPLGKNIKPEYIKSWLEEFSGESLKINHIKRIQLILKRC